MFHTFIATAREVFVCFQEEGSIIRINVFVCPWSQTPDQKRFVVLVRYASVPYEQLHGNIKEPYAGIHDSKSVILIKRKPSVFRTPFWRLVGIFDFQNDSLPRIQGLKGGQCPGSVTLAVNGGIHGQIVNKEQPESCQRVSVHCPERRPCTDSGLCSGPVLLWLVSVSYISLYHCLWEAATGRQPDSQTDQPGNKRQRDHGQQSGHKDESGGKCRIPVILLCQHARCACCGHGRENHAYLPGQPRNRHLEQKEPDDQRQGNQPDTGISECHR